MFNKVKNILIIFLLLSITGLFAQNRGNGLAFQGWGEDPMNGVAAQAMGGAYTAVGGDLNSLFFNPAGLATIGNIKFNIAGNALKKQWQEVQHYRPNREYVTLSFILDGLYVPNPDNNGKWDNDAFFDDTTYIVQDPSLGDDVYSEEAADWKKEYDKTIFNEISVAVPFQLFDKPFAIAAGFSRKFNLMDYDRNSTYLDPHIGSNDYGGIPDKVTDPTKPLDVNWYDFVRSSYGKVDNYTFAVAASLTDYLDLGVNLKLMDGESDDYQHLNKVGTFTLAGQNKFSFTYDTLNTSIKGSSEYSAASFDLGFLFKLKNFNVGVRLTPGYTIEKKWNYVSNNGIDSQIQNQSGTDEIEVPFSYNVGISFRPIETLIVSGDFGKIPYSSSSYQLTSMDTLSNKLNDRTALRIGFEYKALDWLAVRGGYKSISSLFIPDGAADKDSGPEKEAYSFGLSIMLLNVNVDLTYIYEDLKYFDAYFSNTNYNRQKLQNFLIGLTYNL